MCQRVTIIEIAKIAVMTQWVRTGALNRGERSTYSGPPFKANVNQYGAHCRGERVIDERSHDDSRRYDRGKPLARAPRRRLPPPPHRHARRGAGRHPRLGRQSRRETSGGAWEPANLHGLPTDASDYSPRLRRGAWAPPADGRDRTRPARSGLSLPDGEADGDQ